MTKREFLETLGKLDEAITQYERLSQTMRDKATDTSVKFREVNVQKTKTHNSIPIFVEQSLYYQEKADALRRDYDSMFKVLKVGLDALNDPNLESVLTYHYIKRMSIEDVAKEMRISRSTAYSYCNKALDLLELPLS